MSDRGPQRAFLLSEAFKGADDLKEVGSRARRASVGGKVHAQHAKCSV